MKLRILESTTICLLPLTASFWFMCGNKTISLIYAVNTQYFTLLKSSYKNRFVKSCVIHLLLLLTHLYICIFLCFRLSVRPSVV